MKNLKKKLILLLMLFIAFQPLRATNGLFDYVSSHYFDRLKPIIVTCLVGTFLWGVYKAGKSDYNRPRYWFPLNSNRNDLKTFKKHTKECDKEFYVGVLSCVVSGVVLSTISYKQDSVEFSK